MTDDEPRAEGEGARASAPTAAPLQPVPLSAQAVAVSPPMGSRVLAFLKTGPGILVAVVGGATALIGGWTQLYSFFVGPKLEITAQKCEQREFVFRLSNPGGRATTIQEPRFRIYAEGAWAPLLPTEFEARIPDVTTVPAGDPVDLHYPSRIDYFRPEWTGRGQCQIEITVPNNSSLPEVTRSCSCSYRN